MLSFLTLLKMKFTSCASLVSVKANSVGHNHADFCCFEQQGLGHNADMCSGPYKCLEKRLTTKSQLELYLCFL